MYPCYGNLNPKTLYTHILVVELKFLNSSAVNVRIVARVPLRLHKVEPRRAEVKALVGGSQVWLVT